MAFLSSYLVLKKFDIMLVGRDEIQAPLKRPAWEARRWQQVKMNEWHVVDERTNVYYQV